MKKVMLIVVLMGILCFCNQAQAVTIVNTGAGPTVQSGWSLATYQWLAAEFEINQAYSITDIYGWIANYNGGMAHLAIYGDGGNVPDSTNEFYSAQFSIPNNEDITADWYGVSGIDLDLNSGSYWLAFEIKGNDTYSGAMPFYSQSPLPNESYRASDGVWYPGTYAGENGLGLGVQIFANTGVGPGVPEPASMTLLGLGLIGMARRFRKK